MEKQTKQVATMANLVEVIKRVILRQKSDAIQIPLCDPSEISDGNVNLGERVSEDIAAALVRAINEKKALEGVINAQ